MCGDNGVQNQSIRQRKKIAKRKKIKGNAWTLSLILNQPFLSSLSASFSPRQRAEKQSGFLTFILWTQSEEKLVRKGAGRTMERLLEGENAGEGGGVVCL